LEPLADLAADAAHEADEGDGGGGGADVPAPDPSLAGLDRSAAIADLDGVSLSETAAYRAKMGRWRREAVEAVEDDCWWRVLRISAISHCPLDHLLAFLQQRRSHEHLASHGTALCELVVRKAASIALELDRVLDYDWTDNLGLLFVEEGDSVPPDEYLALVVELATAHAIGYHRRFTKPFLRFSQHSSSVISQSVSVSRP
jgi:hypothetical protein